MDIWGPATPQSYNRKLYYVGFTDNYTRWMTIYCINQKLEVLAKYKEYKAWMRTQYSKPIKLLQSDQGGKYLSKEFDSQKPNESKWHYKEFNSAQHTQRKWYR